MSPSPAPSADASSGTVVVTRNITAALRSSLSVALPALSQPADGAVASALARSFASSAASAAGVVGAVTLTPGPLTTAGVTTWVASGTSATGAAIQITITPTGSADGASVALTLTGSLTRSVSSTVAVAADAWASGPSAVAAAAAAAANAPESAASAAAAAAVAEVSAAATRSAAGIGSYLGSPQAVPALTSEVAAALDGEGFTSRASAVRAAGVSISAGDSASDAATLSAPVLGVMTAPAAKAPGGSSSWVLFSVAAGCAAVTAVVTLSFYSKWYVGAESAHAASARLMSATGSFVDNPLRAGKTHPPMPLGNGLKKNGVKAKATLKPSRSATVLTMMGE